jgi:hypothetical protein
MEKQNYDNALTLLEEREILTLKNSILENIKKLEKLENNNILSESDILLEKASLWDKIKYQMGRLGRYKADGKIFGKSKTDQEWAAKIARLVDKKGNEAIKELDTQIKVANSKGKGEFPNNQDPDIFLGIVESIAAVYDSIVAATKMDPKEKGYMPIDAANKVIEDMRTYVKKYLDVDVNWTGSIFDSEEENEELITDEITEDRSKDVRKKLQSKVGKDSEKIDSKRMKTLKSWKLPLALLGTGASFGALSWLIHYLFDPQEITTMSPEEVTSATQEGLGNIQPGEGMTQIMNRTLDMNLSPSSDPNDVVSALGKIGGGDPQVGVDIITQKGGIFADPVAAKSTLTELVANPNAHGDNLGQVFQGDWAGTGKAAGDTLVTVPGGTLKGMIIRSVIKWVSKKTVIGGSKLLIAAPILKVLGIGLFGAGILVKAMREKGKRQSRAKTLNDLLQSLQFVKPTDENTPILPDTPIGNTEGGDEGDEEKETSKKENKNLCSKNVGELNKLLGGAKKRASTLKGMKLIKFSDNEMFQKVLLDNFLNSKVTSIKVNGKPISVTLRQLYDNGLLEAPRSRDMNKKQQLPAGWENQMSSFFSDLFKMFALLNKSCKNNPVYEQTKKLFKQLYIISREGKGSVKDSKKRAELFKKLVGSLHNFFSAVSKVQDFTKGSEGKPSDEEIARRRAAKEKGRQRQDKAGETKKNVKPELAHHDRGNNVIKEEIKRIRQLMK